MLSKRLTAVANLVSKNKVVYDVGSDHGLLPCFLVFNGICPKAYASDNKKGPLNKAITNIEKYNLKGKVIPILADGIEKIANDCSVITICGMGFDTVYHILNDKDLTKYERIIIQINKNTNKLRKWLSDNQYTIVDEMIVYDDFYYEIVVFNAKKDRTLNNYEIEYGPINLKRRETTFLEYLSYQKAKLVKINKDINKASYNAKIKELDDIINENVF